MSKYVFNISEEDAKKLSADNLRITLPLVFPKPRIETPKGSALKALEDIGQIIDQQVMKLVTWPRQGILPDICGTVLSLSQNDSKWNLEFLVQSQTDGTYSEINQKLVKSFGKEGFDGKFVCAPDGGQDEETGEISLHGFTILPADSIRNYEVYHHPVDG